MRHKLLVAAFLLLCAGSIFALTGFGESNTFGITEETLPVEMSYFGAVVSAQNYINITWVTQSETNVSGFQIYRAQTDDMSNAVTVGPFIAATNTSQLQNYQFIDKDLNGSGTYYYWLESIDMDGISMVNGPIQVYYVVDGVNNPAIPIIAGISSIYPNPFNPSTTIKVGITNDAEAKLKIYNARGQLVRTLLQKTVSKGYYNLLWDGRNETGQNCGSGIYFAVLQSGKESFSRKLVLAK